MEISSHCISLRLELFFQIQLYLQIFLNPKEWSVGKVIDHVAAMFKFTNNCHQAVAGPRLQLLSNDGNVFDTRLQLDSQQASGSDIQLVYQ